MEQTGLLGVDISIKFRRLGLTDELEGLSMDRMKMKDLVERYLEHRRPEMVDQTFSNVSSSLGRLATEWDRTRRTPAGISEDWMREFLFQYRRGQCGGRGKMLANSSYNKAVEYIRGFLMYLLRRGIGSPFVLDACKHLPQEEPKEYLRLTTGQVVQMIETCEDPWERFILAFASQTLGRGSELRNRQVRHVHLDRGTIDWYRRKTVDRDELFITRQFAAEWQRWAMAYQDRCGSLQKDWRLVPQRWACGAVGDRR